MSCNTKFSLLSHQRVIKSFMTKNEIKLSEDNLFSDLADIIENRKNRIIRQANNEAVFMFWEVGNRINSEILKNQRAEYGKQIVYSLNTQLQAKYGAVFNLRNIQRMMQFASQFNDVKIVQSLTSHSRLCWTHIVELLPLKDMSAKIYYINEVHKGALTVKSLKYLISRKSYERQELGNAQF